MRRTVVRTRHQSGKRINDPESLEVDFLDPAIRADPWPALARVRERDPVHRARSGTWMITRHADVDALNRDRRLGRDLRQWSKYELMRPFLADSALERSVERWMIGVDPPDHTRLRRLASHAFTSKAMAELRANVERIVEELLERLDGTTEFDYVTAVARPVCVMAIGDLLSFPREDYPLLDGWASGLAVVLEPSITSEQKLRAVGAAGEMTDYVRRLVRSSASDPGDDLLSYMAAGPKEGEPGDEDEVVANVIGLFVAGVTNTIIPDGPLHLLTHPDQFDLLRRDPSLMPRAVEELLRYDSRGINTRIALEDLEVGGKVIKAGQLVFCMLGAANRDPEVFEAPLQMDLRRHPNPHLTFGGGIHHCLGAAMTRLEAQVTFDGLCRRWRRIELDESGVVWNDYFAIRSVDRLPLRVSPN